MMKMLRYVLVSPPAAAFGLLLRPQQTTTTFTATASSCFVAQGRRRCFHTTRTSSLLSLAAALNDSNPSSNRNAEQEGTINRTTRSGQQQQQQQRPVGIFIDLDNVAGGRRYDDDGYELIPTRPSVASWIRPLQQFARAISIEHDVGSATATATTTSRYSSSMNSYLTIQAFANQSTRQWKKNLPDKKEGLIDQEWKQQQQATSQYNDDDDFFLGDDYNRAQTGYDEKGILRCGVCGARMKLTKKDRAKGLDEHDKLEKHMRMLHDREEAKRMNRLQQTRQKGGKKKKQTKKKKHSNKNQELLEKSRKYKAAQIGLNRMKSNDWFRILGEHGVRCYSCNDVDTTLIHHARQWLRDQQEQQKKSSGGEVSPVLVVVSEDSDFLPLLQEVQECGGVAVAATPVSEEQTAALEDGCDVVLTAVGRGRGGSAGIVASSQTGYGDLLLYNFPSPAIFRSEKKGMTDDNNNIDSDDDDDDFDDADDDYDMPQQELDSSTSRVASSKTTQPPYRYDADEAHEILVHALEKQGATIPATMSKKKRPKPWRLALAWHLLVSHQREPKTDDDASSFDYSIALESTVPSFEQIQAQLDADAEESLPAATATTADCDKKYTKGQLKKMRIRLQKERLSLLRNLLKEALRDRGEEVFRVDHDHESQWRFTESVLQEIKE